MTRTATQIAQQNCQRAVSLQKPAVSRVFPWIYAAVVIGSLGATLPGEAHVSEMACLALDAVLVGAFLVVAHKVGLWEAAGKMFSRDRRSQDCSS